MCVGSRCKYCPATSRIIDEISLLKREIRPGETERILVGVGWRAFMRPGLNRGCRLFVARSRRRARASMRTRGSLYPTLVRQSDFVTSAEEEIFGKRRHPKHEQRDDEQP